MRPTTAGATLTLVDLATGETRLNARVERRDGGGNRCVLLESVASRLGLSDQHKEELHRINDALRQKMITWKQQVREGL